MPVLSDATTTLDVSETSETKRISVARSIGAMSVIATMDATARISVLSCAWVTEYTISRDATSGMPVLRNAETVLVV